GARLQAFQGAQQIVTRLAVQPVQIIPAAQPGGLPLGQLSRGNDATLDHLRSCQLALKISPNLAIAYRTYRWQPGVQVISLEQGFDLFDEALFQHDVKTLGNTFVQNMALGRCNGELRDSIR